MKILMDMFIARYCGEGRSPLELMCELETKHDCKIIATIERDKDQFELFITKPMHTIFPRYIEILGE